MGRQRRKERRKEKEERRHPAELDSPRLALKKQLETHCKTAVKEGQGLLGLILAHGNGKVSAFCLSLTTSTVKEDEISKVVFGLDLSVTNVSTAC